MLRTRTVPSTTVFYARNILVKLYSRRKPKCMPQISTIHGDTSVTIFGNEMKNENEEKRKENNKNPFCTFMINSISGTSPLAAVPFC